MKPTSKTKYIICDKTKTVIAKRYIDFDRKGNVINVESQVKFHNKKDVGPLVRMYIKPYKPED